VYLYTRWAQKDFYTFKITQKTNAAYLELHTHTRKTVKLLFQITRFIPVTRLQWMPLVLKMVAPQQRSWCVLQLAKKESTSTAAVQCAFRTQFPHGTTQSSTHVGLRLIQEIRAERVHLYHAQRADQDSCLYKSALSAKMSCTRRKWIPSWVVPREMVCEVHFVRLLRTPSLLTAEHANSPVVV
jgi:hypothetical protein